MFWVKIHNHLLSGKTDVQKLTDSPNGFPNKASKLLTISATTSLFCGSCCLHPIIGIESDGCFGFLFGNLLSGFDNDGGCGGGSISLWITFLQSGFIFSWREILTLCTRFASTMVLQSS